MKSALASVTLLAAVVSAQTTASSSSSSTCAAQNILDACLATTEGYLSACSATDYSCLCDKYTAIMTCFNNCPNDPKASSTSSTQQLYCMNASLYATTTTAATGSSGATAAATTAATATTGTGSAGTATSATASATTTSKSNGAGEVLVNASGMLAAVAGVVAALL
ncbi:hypothetical protein BX600DRAFT_509549 [Xylariales sp. PMI_506]|nr:hypothetical protein BX600DRAFT_509549 [Xylariales sp. PMI_506]